MLEPISDETKNAVAAALHKLIPKRNFVLLVEQPEQPHSWLVSNAHSSGEAKAIVNRCVVKPWNFARPFNTNIDGTQQG